MMALQFSFRGTLARLALVAALGATLAACTEAQSETVPAAERPVKVVEIGRAETARSALALLDLPPEAPVVTRDLVQHAKPDPDLFIAAAQLVGVPITASVVVGDSVWDLLAARRAGALGVGVLSGGYGQDELERAGAYRVYQDPADLLLHLDELGVRSE